MIGKWGIIRRQLPGCRFQRGTDGGFVHGQVGGQGQVHRRRVCCPADSVGILDERRGVQMDFGIRQFHFFPRQGEGDVPLVHAQGGVQYLGGILFAHALQGNSGGADPAQDSAAVGVHGLLNQRNADHQHQNQQRQCHAHGQNQGPKGLFPPCPCIFSACDSRRPLYMPSPGRG